MSMAFIGQLLFPLSSQKLQLDDPRADSPPPDWGISLELQEPSVWFEAELSLEEIHSHKQSRFHHFCLQKAACEHEYVVFLGRQWDMQS